MLNRRCCAHEFANLYYVNGSPLPTGIGGNPSLTIMANARCRYISSSPWKALTDAGACHVGYQDHLACVSIADLRGTVSRLKATHCRRLASYRHRPRRELFQLTTGPRTGKPAIARLAKANRPSQRCRLLPGLELEARRRFSIIALS